MANIYGDYQSNRQARDAIDREFAMHMRKYNSKNSREEMVNENNVLESSAWRQFMRSLSGRYGKN